MIRSPSSWALLDMAVNDFESKLKECCISADEGYKRRFCRIFENTTKFYDHVKHMTRLLRWVHVILEVSNKDVMKEVLTTCLFELIPCTCKYTKKDIFEEKEKTIIFVTLCLSKKEPSHHVVSDFLKALNICTVFII
jgi:hypothetical protein